MASITNEKNGRRTLQFVDANGKRRSVRLGKITKRDADVIKLRVEKLLSAKIAGHTVDNDTAKWLTILPTAVRNKLSNAGLIEAGENTILGKFIDEYLALRKDAKASTLVFYGHTRRNLTEFFGPDKLLRDITEGDAEEFRLYLLEQGLGENSTVRRRCGVAKLFFKFAVRKGLISKNPFDGIKTAVHGNPSKFYFVAADETEKILAACPDAEWRAIVALCRYGGLRCPSEILRLRWSDIEWTQGRMTVWSPKTEHHAGRESRIVPLFPELRTYLEEAYELAEEGAEFVITRYRSAKQNLRTTFGKIIRRAGLNAWPKLFQNLRSSRQTELEDQFPSHVVCSWIGNTESVAKKHYLQVTDAHFEKALHNSVQHTAESPRNASQSKPLAQQKPLQMQGFAANCELAHKRPVGGTGFEPVTSTV